MYALFSIAGGLSTGLIGFYLGLGLVAIVRGITGHDAYDEQVSITIGYVCGLIGWLMGIGMWGAWGREWFGLRTYWRKAPGWQRYFTFSPDHKVIGIQYLVTFIVVFLLAGLGAMLMRWELMESGM